MRDVPNASPDTHDDKPFCQKEPGTLYHVSKGIQRYRGSYHYLVLLCLAPRTATDHSHRWCSETRKTTVSNKHAPSLQVGTTYACTLQKRHPTQGAIIVHGGLKNTGAKIRLPRKTYKYQPKKKRLIAHVLYHALGVRVEGALKVRRVRLQETLAPYRVLGIVLVDAPGCIALKFHQHVYRTASVDVLHRVWLGLFTTHHTNGIKTNPTTLRMHESYQQQHYRSMAAIRSLPLPAGPDDGSFSARTQTSLYLMTNRSTA